MESKSAETSTGVSAEIVLSIIGGGYFCNDNTFSEHFVQVHDGLYSVCGQCFAGKKAQKMMCQSLTHRKKLILRIWIASMKPVSWRKTQLPQLIIPARRV